MGFSDKTDANKELFKVLLVDDDESLRAGVRWQLELSGFVVFEAGQGNEALSMLSKNEIPTLIITDLDMPEMNGVEFISFLKTDLSAKSNWGHIPIIVFSSSIDRHAEISNHIVAFYEKPHGLQSMIDAIKLIYLAK